MQVRSLLPRNPLGVIVRQFSSKQKTQSVVWKEEVKRQI